MKHVVTLYLLSNLGNIYCLHTLYKNPMKYIFIWYTITLFVYIFFFSVLNVCKFFWVFSYLHMLNLKD